MEPCLFRHGKDGPGLGSEVVGGASMEPCLFRHGKVLCLRNIIHKGRLQWSHVFSDMVSGTVLDGTDWGYWLQWSHVFSDMVRSGSEAETGKAVFGFNGAMSFQTW